MSPHLDISRLVKRYAASTVLDAIDLRVARGSFVTIVGPSGCGKTTLLRVVAGLEPASGGTVSLGGERVSSRTQRVGLVFQEHALFPWRTAVGNVELGLEVARVPRQARRAAALDLLRAFGLEGCASRYPHQLSGGMKQRVAIARTLITGPELLLMDEPFNALDGQARAGQHRFLLDLWTRRRDTVLFVTHSLDEAVLLGDAVVVLSPAPARVLGVVPVDLPRPRDPGGEEEAALRGRVLGLLGGVAPGPRPAGEDASPGRRAWGEARGLQRWRGPSRGGGT